MAVSAEVTEVRGLTLYDFSDAEFLAIIQDQGNPPEGWVTSLQVAEAIGLQTENPTNNVGVRMGWMASYGVVQKKDLKKGPSEWRLSDRGRLIVEARFSYGETTLIDGIKDEQLWKLTQKLSDRYVASDAALANLVRREFNLGTYRRRRRMRY